MPRFFTLQEAEELLPSVERSLRNAMESRSSASQSEAQWTALLTRIHLYGGLQIDIGAAAALKSGKEQALERLKQALAEIEREGVVVKDLETGLIDFPTLLDDSEVYLCWKLGEPHIGFWHHVSEGFQGRKSIDQEFLKRHRGGRPH
jgi:hypothetical protein